MKKNKFLFALLGFVCVSMSVLTGCTDNGGTSKTYDFTTATEANFSKAGEDPNDIRVVRGAEGWNPAPSTGDTKYLVIPVDFAPDNGESGSYSCAALPKGCDGTRDEIQAAFFGDTEETGWESVKSFYYKSSYGALNFTGTTTPKWFRVGTTVYDDGSSYVANDGLGFTAREAGGMGTTYTSSILRSAINWYKTDAELKEMMGDDYIDPKDLDSDGDGFIDAVALIYAAPEQLYGMEFFWAYCTFNYAQEGNVDDPKPFQYFWGSYNFIYGDSSYTKPDAHTYIHETGHILGLNDYYNTSKDALTSKQQPAGKVDMMDNNVGDHNSYSKYMLGWVKPYVVNGEGSITIKPFQENGDCILVSANFNGSAYDEYLMIEFHTPTGLNKKDSESKYAGNYPLVMTDNGIKVYHIDSRMAVYTKATEEFVKYTDEYIETSTEKTILAHSNTPQAHMHPECPQIHLLEATGENQFIERGIAASNKTLFKAGQQFGVNVFKDFKFHDGSDLPYVFEITSITDEGATITFLKK